METIEKFINKKIKLSSLQTYNAGDTLRTCSEGTCQNGVEDTYYQVTSDDQSVFLHSWTSYHDTDCIMPAV